MIPCRHRSTRLRYWFPRHSTHLSLNTKLQSRLSIVMQRFSASKNALPPCTLTKCLPKHCLSSCLLAAGGSSRCWHLASQISTVRKTLKPATRNRRRSFLQLKLRNFKICLKESSTSSSQVSLSFSHQTMICCFLWERRNNLSKGADVCRCGKVDLFWKRDHKERERGRSWTSESLVGLMISSSGFCGEGITCIVFFGSKTERSSIFPLPVTPAPPKVSDWVTNRFYLWRESCCWQEVSPTVSSWCHANMWGKTVWKYFTGLLSVNPELFGFPGFHKFPDGTFLRCWEELFCFFGFFFGLSQETKKDSYSGWSCLEIGVLCSVGRSACQNQTGYWSERLEDVWTLLRPSATKSERPMESCLCHRRGDPRVSLDLGGGSPALHCHVTVSCDHRHVMVMGSAFTLN